jgi:hypothetical protein
MRIAGQHTGIVRRERDPPVALFDDGRAPRRLDTSPDRRD